MDSLGQWFTGLIQKSLLLLHQEGRSRVKFCQIKHVDLTAVATPGDKGTAGSSFLFK